MPYLSIFRVYFEKAIVVFEISTFKFVKMQSSMKNKRTSNLGVKMPYFEYFWAVILKSYFHI